MRLFSLLIVAVVGATLTACASGNAKSQNLQDINIPKNPEIIVENPELSDADKARLSGQLQEAMNREVARRNTPVSVPNISRVDNYEQMVDGKKYHFIDFHTADGKMYRTRQKVGIVSPAQVEKLKRLKGATFRTTVPISGNPNHFFAAGLEKPVF